MSDFSLNFEAQRSQMIGNLGRSPELAIAQLRILVDVSTPLDHFALYFTGPPFDFVSQWTDTVLCGSWSRQRHRYGQSQQKHGSAGCPGSFDSDLRFNTHGIFSYLIVQDQVAVSTLSFDAKSRKYGKSYGRKRAGSIIVDVQTDAFRMLALQVRFVPTFFVAKVEPLTIEWLIHRSNH